MAGKLKSRKLWLAIITAVCALFLAISGAIDWSLGIKIITGALGGFIGMEGLADALGRLGLGK